VRSPLVNQLRTERGPKGLIHLADLYALRAGALACAGRASQGGARALTPGNGQMVPSLQ
jgi:DNA topoisomerase IB